MFRTNKALNERKEIDEINEIIEDNISISESNSNDKSIMNLNKIKTINSIKESSYNSIDSSSLSDDNQGKIDNRINTNQIFNKDNEKMIEKTNSSFKDDKSTKVELDKITYSEV